MTIHVGLISYSEGKSKNMDFLKTISVVNGIPLARNQVLILHSLLAHDITIPDSINSTLDVWTIETIVAIVELLALCSVGHHAEVARIVRQYLPLESVLGVLADTETPLPYEQQVPGMWVTRRVLPEGEGFSLHKADPFLGAWGAPRPLPTISVVCSPSQSSHHFPRPLAFASFPWV